ncbi:MULTISPECIES: AdeC/AdeK/OprM family multidrug efflux complex outer membrane factor [unclassified Cupriavidus]|uniref:AdeC/AdeK/OprM family multidrug efflux complex outer membrane factor n=1 Tax=unclassified Cupriavidus TaxID=2640874 RepID=UPI001C00432F|nr:MULTISPECIES: AdeC/AdeK/OprM family multidrug efflux complex outer membrane factor [unclassified Cupriavidus]MCA3182829.1 AdeC/AdeK/OprM family multidrug efflux complex outer membrane factor [Cupriavidus sp.]MCA3193615.1 AdeC/AdeK/OprM family multidrug efflux complex outer membrane factor [Cupriavidus sp.]MCA3200005.1 AdeC/AdeK/OprM family multidrug efflux complex outer membrane factor [Cupriavidus sp.]MCA3202018.1 AdeC/AdeK/OprM family multidrug efflux complex outer membrane factor [Cupriav
MTTAHSLSHRASRADQLRRTGTLALTVLAAAVLAGCAALGNSHSTQTMTDASTLASPQTFTNEHGQWPSQDWVDQFHDAQLRALVDEAIQGNPNLQVAFGRLAASRAMADATRAALYPGVDFEGSLVRQRFSETDLFEGTPLAGSWQNQSRLQLGFSWDLDFWGKNRDALEAALSDDRAMEAETQAARLVLTTSVARSYNRLAALYAQRDVAERAIAQRRDLTDLSRQRLAAGLDTQVETTQARGTVAAAQTDLQRVDEEIALARNQIAALLGKGPDRGLQIAKPTLLANATPQLPDDLTIGLIGRRPDLVAARWRVEASSKDITVAKKEFLPDVKLTAFAGVASLDPSNLLMSMSRTFGVGPSLTLPIFQGGRLRANLKGKYAQYDIAAASYNQTLVDALRETADTVTSIRSVDQQIQTQREALDLAEHAYSLATMRYKAGLGTQLTVLNAESNVLQQRRLATDLQARRLDLQIGLMKALGGGYEEEAAARTGTPHDAGKPAGTAQAAQG